MERRPSFLEPEYPFEWTGVYSLEAGRYAVSLAEGPDPTMSLAVMADQGTDDEGLRAGAEWCVRRYADPAEPIGPGATLPMGTHVNLQLQEPGRKSFFLEVDAPVKVGLYGQHTAEEFDLKVIHAENEQEVSFDVDRTWVAQHEHDDEVGSFAIERDGDLRP